MKNRKNRKNGKNGKRRYVIGAAIPLVVSLGLWLGLGSASAARAPKHRPVSAQVMTGVQSNNFEVGGRAKLDTALPNKVAVYASSTSENPNGPDTDNVQSGDQNSLDDPSEDPSSEGESTTPESDGVDCQQDGNFEGVNAAGTGQGCDGSGV